MTRAVGLSTICGLALRASGHPPDYRCLPLDSNVEDVGKDHRSRSARYMSRKGLRICSLGDDRPNANAPGIPRETAEVFILQLR